MPESGTAFDPDKYLAEKAQATQVANTFDPDKYLAEKSQSAAPTYGPSMQSAAAGLQSGLNTITLGAANPMISALTADYNTVKNKVTGKGDLSFDEWKKNYQADVDQTRAAMAAHPTAQTVGSIAGAFEPTGPAAALAGKVKGLVGAGAEAAGSLVPEAVASSKAGGLIGRTLTGAAEGAGTATALEAPRQAIEGSTGFIKKGDKDVADLDDVGKVGALVGGGIPLAGAAASALGKAGAYSGKKLMASFLGPSEAHINYYLENPTAVNNAPSMAALKEKVDGVTEKLREDVENGKLSVSEAQSQLKDVNDAAQSHRKDSNDEFRRTSWEVKQTFAQAKKDLADALEKKTNDLKGVKAPVDLAPEAAQAVKDLKGKIIQGSQDATQLISPETEVNTHSPYQVLKQAQERLSPAGTGPITPQAQAAHQEIQKLMNTFGSLPGKMDGNQTKALIKQLDQSQQAIYNSGEFTDDVSKAYKSLRAQLDEQLKAQNPAYAEAMKGVAADTGLHGDVVGRFGDQGAAASALNTIAGPAKAAERANLAKLGQATGRDFESPINAHVQAQGILKDPVQMQQMEQGLPQYPKMLEAEKAAKMVSHPAAGPEFADRRLQESGLLKQQTDAQGLLAQRQEGLVGAQDRAVAAKGLTPLTSQNRLETAGRGLDTDKEKIEAVKQLTELSKMSDTDFVKAIKDRATKNAFEGQDTNGSRKVNLFGSILGAAGGFLTHGLIGAGAGIAAGATAGAIADKYGPKIAKSMLDGALKIQGSPTLAKIQALEIPPQVKAALARELADYNQPEKK